MLAQGLDTAVGDDVVGADEALGQLRPGRQPARHVPVGAVMGRVDGDEVRRRDLQAVRLHPIDKGLRPQAEIHGLDVAGDEADPREAHLDEVRDDLIHRVAVVHVHEAGVEPIEQSVDEHQRRLDPVEQADVVGVQLGAQHDHAVQLGGKRRHDVGDRIALEVHHLQLVAAPHGFLRHAVDVVSDEGVVVAVHGVAVLGDLEEPQGARPRLLNLGLLDRVVEVGRHLEDALAGLLGDAALAVEHQGDGRNPGRRCDVPDGRRHPLPRQTGDAVTPWCTKVRIASISSTPTVAPASA